MTTFIQFHALIPYAAANPNRDDSGRPKTMIYGGVERLRISSQSLKRAMRDGAVFRSELEGLMGVRAQSFARELEQILKTQHDVAPDKALAMARKVVEADRMGKLKGATTDTEQLAFLGPDEIARLRALAPALAAGEELPAKEAVVLLNKPRAVDIALFGRMLADNPGYNVEAACQVAHAFTTHRAAVEDDYFTAVEELKRDRPGEDAGAGFIGVQEFGSGTFYLYVCLDADQLIANLAGDHDLAARTGAALAAAVAHVAPTGKQNAFASRVRAHYLLVEVGSAQPRTLGTAFQTPVNPRATNDVVSESVKQLKALRDGFAEAYGRDWDDERELTVSGPGATMTEIAGFVADAIRKAGSRG